jgi:hypothetical protein
MSLLKIELHKFFICFFMGLSQSNNLGCEFDRLIRVNSGFFSGSLSMRLSRSHNLNHEFERLTQVFFLIAFFNIELIEN